MASKKKTSKRSKVAKAPKRVNVFVVRGLRKDGAVRDFALSEFKTREAAYAACTEWMQA